MSDVREDCRLLFLAMVRRRIAIRAYELFLARGGVAGTALQDWLTAEDEVVGQSILAPLYKRLNMQNDSVP